MPFQISVKKVYLWQIVDCHDDNDNCHAEDFLGTS